MVSSHAWPLCTYVCLYVCMYLSIYLSLSIWNLPAEGAIFLSYFRAAHARFLIKGVRKNLTWNRVTKVTSPETSATSSLLTQNQNKMCLTPSSLVRSVSLSELIRPIPVTLSHFYTELQGQKSLSGPAGGTVGAIIHWIIKIGETTSVERTKWNDPPFRAQMRCECSKSPVFISPISAVHHVHGTVEAAANVMVRLLPMPLVALRHLPHVELQTLIDKQPTYEQMVAKTAAAGCDWHLACHTRLPLRDSLAPRRASSFYSSW